MVLSKEYWDCKCDEKYIQPNSKEKCYICDAHRDEMPDSRQNEIDDGTHFAEEVLSDHRQTVRVEKDNYQAAEPRHPISRKKWPVCRGIKGHNSEHDIELSLLHGCVIIK